MAFRARPLARALFVVAAAVAATAPTVHLAAPARAATSTTPTLSGFDTRLLSDMNHARAARGLHRLAVVAGTTDVAHGWSCHLASAALLSHDPTLASALETHGSLLWTVYGENVGVQSASAGADHLFHAYMNSPTHRANILDPDFRYVGVWSKRSNGKRWNTVDFVGRPVTSYDDSYGPTRRTC